MKKSLAAAALGCLLVYTAWITYPPSLYLSEVESLVAQMDQLHAESQKQAGEPAHNAYLNGTFRPLWGRPDLEYQEHNPLAGVLSRTARWSCIAEGGDTHLAEKLTEPQTEQDFRAFAQIYPELHRLLELPLLCAPDPSRPTVQTVPPNLVVCRKIGEALLAYTDYLDLRGQSGLEALQDDYRLSGLLLKPPSDFLHLMLALSIQKSAHLETLQRLARPQPWTTAQLQALASTLADTQLTQKPFTQALDLQFYAGYNFLNGQPAPAQLQPWVAAQAPPMLLSLPGMRSRERRIFQNRFFELLHRQTQGQLAPMPQRHNWTTSDFATGEQGILTDALLPHTGRAQRIFLLRQKTQAILHLWLCILAQHQETGHWPQQIQDLRGYRPLEGLDPAQVQLGTRDSTFELRLTLSQWERTFEPPDPLIPLESDQWVLRKPQQPAAQNPTQ